MAKYENGRVYFEKFKITDTCLDAYIEEIGQVIDTGITDTLFVCDAVYYGKENENSLCNLFITVSNESSEKECALIKKVWWKIISKEISNSKILNLVLWKYQTEIINEIKSKFLILETEDFDEQLFFKISVSPSVIEYIEKNSFDEFNKLKWFDFTLGSHVKGEAHKIKLNSTHDGRDYSLYSLDRCKVDSILTMLDGNFLQVNIMPTGE